MLTVTVPVFHMAMSFVIEKSLSPKKRGNVYSKLCRNPVLVAHFESRTLQCGGAVLTYIFYLYLQLGRAHLLAVGVDDEAYRPLHQPPVQGRRAPSRREPAHDPAHRPPLRALLAHHVQQVSLVTWRTAGQSGWPSWRRHTLRSCPVGRAIILWTEQRRPLLLFARVGKMSIISRARFFDVSRTSQIHKQPVQRLAKLGSDVIVTDTRIYGKPRLNRIRFDRRFYPV